MVRRRLFPYCKISHLVDCIVRCEWIWYHCHFDVELLRQESNKRPVGTGNRPDVRTTVQIKNGAVGSRFFRTDSGHTPVLKVPSVDFAFCGVGRRERKILWAALAASSIAFPVRYNDEAKQPPESGRSPTASWQDLLCNTTASHIDKKAGGSKHRLNVTLRQGSRSLRTTSPRSAHACARPGKWRARATAVETGQWTMQDEDIMLVGCSEGTEIKLHWYKREPGVYRESQRERKDACGI